MGPTTINNETGEPIVEDRSARFMQWIAFFVFSIIVLGSAVQVKSNSDNPTEADSFAVACAAVTFVVTMAAIAAQLHPLGASFFVGTQVEGIVCTILLAFWTTIVAINTEAGDSLREIGVNDESNAVQNANLYYFSWAGFITAVMLMVSFLRDVTGIDMIENVQSRGQRLQYWGAFLATAIVVMGGASRTLQQDCPDESKPGYCPKTVFAITVGTFGCFLATLVILSKVVSYSAIAGATPFLLELGSSVFLTIMNALGVAYTTSAGGPGSQIGNLYYFSWGSFLVAAVLAAECYKEYANPQAADAASQNNGTSENGRTGDVVMVEQFDDAI